MRLEVEFKEKDVEKIIQILNSLRGEEIDIRSLTIQLAKKSLPSTDYLFIILQKLSSFGLIESRRGFVKVKEEIKDEIVLELMSAVERRVRKLKFFITPLEVAKFYQCPRRLWLEKVVLSRQFKEKKGKVWDGEVLHLAVNILVKRIKKGETVEELINEAAKEALKKYEGKTELSKETLVDFLEKFYNLINDENFSQIFSEKKIISLKHAIVGTPDLIGIRDGRAVAIDLKLGRLSKKGVKFEHVLQSIGEAIITEDYFRIPVKYAYIIYFQSNSIAKIEITEELKKKFFSLKKEIFRMFSSNRIPPKSRLPNYRNRVCKGCHVRPACENIEKIKRIAKRFLF